MLGKIVTNFAQNIFMTMFWALSQLYTPHISDINKILIS